MNHTQILPKIVIDACNSYIDARQARIQRESEQQIARWVGIKLWFWSQPMTREQAEDYCSEELGLIRITGGAWANRVHNLLSLARIAEKSNTLVTLDSEMAGFLESHFG